ncbi:hypothetical protein J2754_001237 [Halarchaeum solikamskense]|uniref:DUF3054 domain-containing protein n=1 Tax=Halarchaeum nitratireducens TaxID=489913 RepID=UPI001B3A8877|nr:DUF3054 domain-containing protein [Halarchaeum solikamskense]MBP2250920.1 hypothetical protein [Halarchaeum solikamskense]
MSLLDVDRRTVRTFALADLVAIVAFVLVGEYQHGMLVYTATHPLRFLGVLAPFLVGWIAAAPLLRAYSVRTHDPRGLVGWTLASWLAADVLGQALLLSGAFPIGYDPIFAVVVAVFGSLFLLLTRGVAYATLRR